MHPCWNRLVAGVVVLTAGALRAAPDASVESVPLPRSGEHRALEKQVELMRAEVAKPRDWYDRDKADRLKAELTSLERALNRVEEIYTAKMDACRAYYLQTGRDPRTQGVEPGYYMCFEKPPVDDDTVRAIRRVEELKRRLADRGLPSATRDSFKAELRALDARLEREAGFTPLYMEGTETAVDAGQAAVPQRPPPGRKP